ncbi:M48 family metalloprotease [Flavobacterium sp. UBA6135]|uniref:M48 family metalloprotease n=1 Tax=Flavobacterium sp. UBA6135 TaxID=1946553 RepID=UPI0025B9EB36|nr:M48 family metalloprotease [Flavobacterium sp. UBA6135]
MKKATYLFGLIFFLIGLTVSGQQETVIDTTDKAYRNLLELKYLEITSKTELKLKNLPDKKVRKYLVDAYPEKKKEFLNLIKKGVFVEDEKYSPLLKSTFEEIKNANSDYDLSDILVLLSLNEQANAYNYGDGIIVINLPLAHNLDNEYQLAYVMSHEIAHQLLDHVNISMFKNAELNTSKGVQNQSKEIEKEKFNKQKKAETYLKKLVYSSREGRRKHEHQADSLGFILFNKAYPKHMEVALNALRLLKTIDEEKDSLVSENYKRVFTTPNQNFKDEWLISNKLANYNYSNTIRFWEVDSLRTHPDIDTRINFLKRTFNISPSNEVINFSPYNKIKKDANKEYVLILYFQEEYGKSLYHTLISLKYSPDDVFYKKMLHDNLNKLREARNNYTLNRFLDTENPKFSKSYNSFLSFIRNLRKAEFNEITEHYKY